ncbi:MAG: hypothetical protein DRG09_03570 [Epsilonproteobacteria bacterium]|nr:MAG: hypothetical protein DRG09_03570 [Campylobacterota bacterium]
MKKLLKWIGIAMLFGATGQLIAAESYGKAEDPLVAEVLGMEIRTKDVNIMQAVIGQKLLEKYAEQQKIEVSQKDIDLYIANLDAFIVKDRKRREAEMLEVQEKLKSGSLLDEEKKNLQSNLTVLESLQKMEVQEDKEKAMDPKGAIKDKQTVAKTFIKQGLINKALYKQYGGRIIFQQMGAEPYDAMHKFLKEEEKNESFKIIDKSFEASFWNYYADESKHSFYKKGSKEEKEVLDKFFK